MVVPRNGPSFSASPSLHGVPVGPVPPLQRYYGSLRALLSFPLRFGLTSRSAVPRGHPVRLLVAAGGCAAAIGCFGRVASGLLHVESADASQVPGEPQCMRAPLFDPGGTPASGRCDAFVLPRCPELPRLPRSLLFRGSVTRPTCSLSTLRGEGSPQRHARLASGWWPAFAGRDWLPAGFLRGFHVMS